MKKITCRRIFALCFMLMLSIAFSVSGAFTGNATSYEGFDKQVIEIAGENEAFNGWQYYIFNGEYYYQSKDYSVKAVNDTVYGKALMMERLSANEELCAYSYGFPAEASCDYVVYAYIGCDCENGIDNGVSLRIKETDENGNVCAGTDENSKLYTLTGSHEGYKRVSFIYKTSENVAKLQIMVDATGVGRFFVKNVSVHKVLSETEKSVNYTMQAIGKTSAGANFDNWENTGMGGIDPAKNLSSDSSDGDGFSLKLNERDGDVFKTRFGFLPYDGTKLIKYRLSFKYKNLGKDPTDGPNNHFMLKIDGYRLNLERSFYMVNPNDQGLWIWNGSSTEWTPMSYEFYVGNGRADGNCTINGLTIGGVKGSFLIDELSLESVSVDDEAVTPMQWIVNGSFSGAYTNGYELSGNMNVASQGNGEYAFVSSANTMGADNGNGGCINVSTAHLEKGKTYTLSFKYRGGDKSYSVYNLPGGAVEDENSLVGSGEALFSREWKTAEIDFVAGGENSSLRIYGNNGLSGYASYIADFGITDEQGRDYIVNKRLSKADGVAAGENVFPYGTFSGNVQTEWSFSGNAELAGFKYEDGNRESYLILNGSVDTPATATSKEFAVNKSILAVDLKYCEQGQNVRTVILVGESEIEADEQGLFNLPENVTSVRVKLISETGYAAICEASLLSHEHSFGSLQEKASTCFEAGGKYKECSGCGKKEYTEIYDKLSHEYEHVSVKPTCRDGGEKDVCKHCGDEQNVTVVPATGEHEFERVVVKAPDCIHSGIEADKCKHCGKQQNTAVVPATGKHEYVNGTCKDCGATEQKSGGCSSGIDGTAAILAVGCLVTVLFAVGRKRKKD